MRIPSRRTSRRPTLRALLVGATLLGACASTPPVPIEALTFAPHLGIDLASMRATTSGVRYIDVAPGPGVVIREGHQIDVFYAGWLPDGTQVDAVTRPSAPLTFRVGRREVIRGWEDAVIGMRVGGQRRIVVPPELAYGSRSVGHIPRNATLVFLIHVVDVH